MKTIICTWVAASVLAAGSATTVQAAPGPAGQPLAVHRSFPACFQGHDGRPLLLVGAYTWGTFSDVDYDYVAMFDTLQAHGLNFARVWLWWGAEEFPKSIDRRYIVPYERPGPGIATDGRPKYDLNRFNPAFFDRLRRMCVAARERGLCLQLVLFDAWMLKHAHLWQLHAFHRDNNVNGVDGDPRQSGKGTDGQRGFCSLGNTKAMAAQQAYIRQVVDAVNEFDQVLLEVANENYYSVEWEQSLCEFIQQHEQGKPKQHLTMPKDLLNHSSVVQTWDIRRIHAALLEKRGRRQPLIFDTDWTINPDDDPVRRAMWAAVLSGGHFNYMDESFQIGSEHHGDFRGSRRADLHRQIGYLAAFMRQTRFWEMAPDDALVKAGAAFAVSSTNELAAYLPAGARVTLDLSRLSGQLEARWFDPRAGTWGEPWAVSGGRAAEFIAPTADQDWALLVRRSTRAALPTGPTRVRAKAMTRSSVEVTWHGATEAAGAAGDKVLRSRAGGGVTLLPGYIDAPLGALTQRK